MIGLFDFLVNRRSIFVGVRPVMIWAIRNESRLTQLSSVYSDVKVQIGKDKEILFEPASAFVTGMVDGVLQTS